MKEQNFCVAPWTNLHIHPSGHVRPCCIAQLDLANLREGETLESAWNSPQLKNLRQQFLQGGRPAVCQSCYDKEAAGVSSTRQQLNERYGARALQTDSDSPDSAGLLQLDLSFTNECNLTCRMCGPSCSSKWIQLGQRIPADSQSTLWQWYKSDRWQVFELSADDLSQQMRNFSRLCDFEIKGGEPFISKEHDRFLERLSASPRASALMFRYVTNGTHVSEATMAALRKFRDAHIWVSVDGTGAIFKYIRGGKIDLSRVENNLRKLATLERFRLGIVFTLSIYNIFAIRDFWRWYQSMREELPKLDIWLGMVRSPVFLNVANFPASLRETALSELPQEDHPFLNSIRQALTHQSKQAGDSRILRDFREFTETMDQVHQTALLEMEPRFEPLWALDRAVEPVVELPY